MQSIIVIGVVHDDIIQYGTITAEKLSALLDDADVFGDKFALVIRSHLAELCDNDMKTPSVTINTDRPYMETADNLRKFLVVKKPPTAISRESLLAWALQHKHHELMLNGVLYRWLKRKYSAMSRRDLLDRMMVLLSGGCCGINKYGVDKLLTEIIGELTASSEQWSLESLMTTLDLK